MDKLFLILIDPKTWATLAILFAWAMDRYGWFAWRKKSLSPKGKWNGWSIYLDSGQYNLSNHRDTETFFQIEFEIKQRFKRLIVKQTINSIHDENGNFILKQKRMFKGYGEIIGNDNLLFILDETNGMTCASFYLKLDVWGNNLDGFAIVRNVDGQPVIIRVACNRHEQPDIEFNSVRLIKKPNNNALQN